MNMMLAKELLRTGLEKVFLANNTSDIIDAIHTLRRFFESIGVPAVENEQVKTNITSEPIYISGSTKVIYKNVSIQEIEKYWLGSDYKCLTGVFSKVFMAINSILPYIPELQNLAIQVPTIEIIGSINTDLVNYDKVIAEINNITYDEIIKYCNINKKFVSIDNVYVVSTINGEEYSYYNLPKVRYSPTKLRIQMYPCDSDEFNHIPEL